ncbi:hypothetical protein DICVIV_12032 [Dictyocaulus viviparus]|uniref:Tropomyosin n=1 Tax=Dictyocaulus viviparus TaxID=29172 RepID=A0A0D8XE93_DICVI|nr:hypothetical protein DICVIV_12032 [Dictyocaulus viviparus]
MDAIKKKMQAMKIEKIKIIPNSMSELNAMGKLVSSKFIKDNALDRADAAEEKVRQITEKLERVEEELRDTQKKMMQTENDLDKAQEDLATATSQLEEKEKKVQENKSTYLDTFFFSTTFYNALALICNSL